jgi:hypothetical protein
LNRNGHKECTVEAWVTHQEKVTRDSHDIIAYHVGNTTRPEEEVNLMDVIVTRTYALMNS